MKKLFSFLLIMLILTFVPDFVNARTHNWYYIEYNELATAAQVSDIYKPEERNESTKVRICLTSEKEASYHTLAEVIGEQADSEAEDKDELTPSETFDEKTIRESVDNPLNEQSGQEETEDGLTEEERKGETKDTQTTEEDKEKGLSKDEMGEKEEEGSVNKPEAGEELDEETAGFEEDEFLDEEIDEELEQATVSDPIKPFNYAMFVVNDKLYFFFFKPLAQGWGFIVPELGRIGVQNVFNNVAFPVRFFNNLFQAKLKRSGIELSRFLINTTVGIVGIFDPAKRWFGLQPYIEDFGQTLGVWGLGHGFYITCPFVGPLTVRDGLGRIPDMALDPLTYIPFIGWLKKINETSLKIGDYEALKEASLDPYIAVRNAYIQHRNALTAE
jgi:phospholipid-binding lipoprotein MlaA